MKSFIISLFMLCALTVSSFAHAAEDFTLWPTGTVFASPYATGVITTSAELNNNNGLSSLEVIINIESATPDQCNSEPADYKLFFVIEGSISGLWYPIATTFSKYNNCDDGTKRILIISPTAPDLNGSDFVLSEGSVTVAKISYTIGTLTEKFRVKIVLQQGSNAPLTSLTVSGFGRKYSL